jgi:hypothetical protein
VLPLLLAFAISSTCDIFHWSTVTGNYASAQSDSGSSCSAEFQTVLPNRYGGESGFYAFARTNADPLADTADARGFFLSFTDSYRYGIFAGTESSELLLSEIHPIVPGGTDGRVYGYARAESRATFYERTFLITNPAAASAGFLAAPTIDCETRVRAMCDIEWEGVFALGSPFTIRGTAIAESGNGAGLAAMHLRFDEPAYTFVVRDSQGNIIPEAQWSDVAHAPEPSTMVLIAAGLAAVFATRTRRSLQSR